MLTKAGYEAGSTGNGVLPCTLRIGEEPIRFLMGNLSLRLLAGPGKGARPSGACCGVLAGEFRASNRNRGNTSCPGIKTSFLPLPLITAAAGWCITFTRRTQTAA